MAKVTPYGDKQAHGTIGKTLTFRRYRGDVVLEKKPHPKQPDTPGQYAQREKFKQAWKSYHGLSEWVLTYLGKKATEKQTTKANLYLSQFLLDEIPSTTPETTTEKVTDLSLPVPISPVAQGLKIEMCAFTEDGSIFDPLAQIYDNANIYINIQIKITYTILCIRISNLTGDDIVIPSDYPIIMNGEDHSGEEFIDLIKLPYYVMSQTTQPSETPKTNMNFIILLTIDDVIGVYFNDIKFDFKVKKAYPESDILIRSISDHENIMGPPGTDTPQVGMYLEISHPRSPSIIIPDGYSFSLGWTPPSRTPMTNLHDITAMIIDAVIGVYPNDLTFEFTVKKEAPGPDILIASIQDLDNVFHAEGTDTPQEGVYLTISHPTAPSIIIPDNYSFTLTWTPPGGPPEEIILKLPRLDIGNSGPVNDYSLSEVKEIIDAGLFFTDADEPFAHSIWLRARVHDPYSLQTLMGIYDNTNVLNEYPPVSTYDVVVLRINNAQNDPWTIPAGYGLWVQWKDFSDVVRLKQIKLPEIEMAGQSSAEYYLSKDFSLYAEWQLNTLIVDNTVEPTKLWFANDWTSYFNESLTQLAKAYVPETPGPPSDEEILKLPRLDIGKTGAPSTYELREIVRITAAELFFTVGINPTDYSIGILAYRAEPYGSAPFMSITDKENLATIWPDPPYVDAISIRIFNWTTNPWQVPEGYGLYITWEDNQGVSRYQKIKVPSVLIQPAGHAEYWLSEDFSLYEEWQIVNLVMDNTVEPLKLWFADDWSLYFDEALTQLAKANQFPPLILYVAADMSLYWDKELTQLANTPFY